MYNFYALMTMENYIKHHKKLKKILLNKFATDVGKDIITISSI